MTSSDRRWLATMPICLGILVACAREVSPRPGPQFVLEYQGADGIERDFRLKNQTTDVVAIRGIDGFFAARPLQGINRLECQPVGRDEWLSDTKIVEAGAERIELNPGDSKKLKMDGTFMRDYPGGKCRLRITLEDGRSIQSNTFVP